MLIAMLTVFLLGGGLLGGSMITPSDIALMNERVELAVEDPKRAAVAKEALVELETEVEDFNKTFIDSGDRLSALYLDHGASSYETLRTLESLNVEWYASQNRTVKLRARLKESITAEEWAKIFGAGQAVLPSNL
jgi:hypothetical protein